MEQRAKISREKKAREWEVRRLQSIVWDQMFLSTELYPGLLRQNAIEFKERTSKDIILVCKEVQQYCTVKQLVKPHQKELPIHIIKG